MADFAWLVCILTSVAVMGLSIYYVTNLWRRGYEPYDKGGSKTHHACSASTVLSYCNARHLQTSGDGMEVKMKNGRQFDDLLLYRWPLCSYSVRRMCCRWRAPSARLAAKRTPSVRSRTAAVGRSRPQFLTTRSSPLEATLLRLHHQNLYFSQKSFWIAVLHFCKLSRFPCEVLTLDWFLASGIASF